MIYCRWICTFIIAFMAARASAYKQDVHMVLIDKAVEQSVLSGAIWSDWGLPNKDREQFTFIATENNFHTAVKPTDKLGYKELLSYGVDAEDTGIGADVFGRYFSRAFDHFYNPQANSKINLFNAYVNYTNPDWALESAKTDGYPSIAGQDFSYSDAQVYFYAAFAASTNEDRRRYMGRTFQTLGHVVHLLQDAAQPEHTRIDQHCDAPVCNALYAVAQDDGNSLYEQFTQALRYCTPTGLSPIPLGPINSTVTCDKLNGVANQPFITRAVYLGEYPIPKFAKPEDYWHTADLKGMADFSSMNFISSDTGYNLGPCTEIPCNPGMQARLYPNSADLPYPSGDPSTTWAHSERLSDIVHPNALGALGKYKDTNVRFIGLTTRDYFTGQDVTIPRMATYSVFTERLAKVSFTRGAGEIPVFAVNYFNLEQWSQLLLPRAVAYSTGLINYFFRYRISVTEKPASSGISTWEVRNLSEYDFNGCIEIFYENQNGIRNSLNRCSNGQSETIGAGQTLDIGTLRLPSGVTAEKYLYAVAKQYNPRDNRNLAVAATRFLYTPPPEPCGNSISFEGGYQTVIREFDLGTSCGYFTVSWDMRDIPDSISITNVLGTVKGGSGSSLISGTGESTIVYYPSSTSENERGYFPKRIARVKVTGGSPETKWYIKVSCPVKGFGQRC